MVHYLSVELDKATNAEYSSSKGVSPMLYSVKVDFGDSSHMLLFCWDEETAKLLVQSIQNEIHHNNQQSRS
mgnify:CR=1 FL=1